MFTNMSFFVLSGLFHGKYSSTFFYNDYVTKVWKPNAPSHLEMQKNIKSHKSSRRHGRRCRRQLSSCDGWLLVESDRRAQVESFCKATKSEFERTANWARRERRRARRIRKSEVVRSSEPTKFPAVSNAADEHTRRVICCQFHVDAPASDIDGREFVLRAECENARMREGRNVWSEGRSRTEPMVACRIWNSRYIHERESEYEKEQ